MVLAGVLLPVVIRSNSVVVVTNSSLIVFYASVGIHGHVHRLGPLLELLGAVGSGYRARVLMLVVQQRLSFHFVQVRSLGSL